MTILGPTNLPSTVPYHASQMYAKNITTFLNHLVKDGSVRIDQADEITRETLVTHEGAVVNPRIRELVEILRRRLFKRLASRRLGGCSST